MKGLQTSHSTRCKDDVTEVPKHWSMKAYMGRGGKAPPYLGTRPSHVTLLKSHKRNHSCFLCILSRSAETERTVQKSTCLHISVNANSFFKGGSSYKNR